MSQAEMIQSNDVAPGGPAMQDKAHEKGRHWLLPEDATKSLVALFAGQGANPLKDLSQSKPKWSDKITEFVRDVSDVLVAETATPEALETGFRFVFGLNVSDWVDKLVTPTREYLHSAPISSPTIMLAQVVRYLLFLERFGVTHKEMLLKHWKAAAGHSQGVVTAVLIAASADESELLANAQKFALYMLWQGLRCHNALNEEVRGDRRKAFSMKQDTGKVRYSPMLAVRGLSKEDLQDIIAGVETAELAKREYVDSLRIAGTQPRAVTPFAVSVALVNGPTACVVSGAPKHLELVWDAVENKSAAAGSSQSRIPFAERKPKVEMAYVRTSVAFHSVINEPAVAELLEDCARCGVEVNSQNLKIPVLDTETGEPMQHRSEKCLLERLIKLQCIHLNDFHTSLKLLQQDPTPTRNVIDFGPGTGVAEMCADFVVGSKTMVVSCCASTSSKSPGMVALDIAAASEEHIIGLDWKETFSPQLSKRRFDGMSFIDSKFTRLVGKPPVMMAGMTPTTSLNGLDLVAACSNAGFHCELAAGGLPTPEIFKSAIISLLEKLHPGVGISINMLYLNPRQWGFQFPLVLDLRRQGIPIESITIGAGVPSPDKASQIIEQLLRVGIRYISLKPGNGDAIISVLNIAKAHPAMGVILQWTGGRAGGHHSCEDFHEPLLEHYAVIRSVENVVLVLGSGFGNSEDSLPYLKGSWSVPYKQSYGKHMPADGILMGSRCMVAKEAATSKEVKELIIAANGILNEKCWLDSYKGTSGGVLSVKSELGEQIHMIANRGTLCWRWLEQNFFVHPKGEKRTQAIAARKWDIIARLNSDFQKPYFGRKGDGSVAELEDLTYVECLQRMVEVMTIQNGEDASSVVWVHPSYFERTMQMLQRSERVFSTSGESLIKREELKLRPCAHITDLGAEYPKMQRTLLADRDVDFFLHTCRSRAFGKPVNFVPVIDADLEYWFKKDSLWYSERIEAVPGKDPQRVCVLHGPVAARYSSRADESICDILSGVHNGYVKALASCGAIERVVDLLGGPASTENFVSSQQADQPSTWVDIVLHSPTAVRGKRWTSNPIRALFTEADGQERSEGQGIVRVAALKEGKRYCEATFDTNRKLVHLAVDDQEEQGEHVQLTLSFAYDSTHSVAPLQYSAAEEKSIRRFYSMAWHCQKDISSKDEICSSAVVSQEAVHAFNRAVGYETDESALDMATVLCWKPLTSLLLASDIGGNLLNLVHLSNEYQALTNDDVLVAVGDSVGSKARITEVRCKPKLGTTIEVSCVLSRKENPWLKLTSSFLIRGMERPYNECFSRRTFRGSAHVSNPDVLAQLQAQPWLEFRASADLRVHDHLWFELPHVFEQGDRANGFVQVEVQGCVYLLGRDVAVDDINATRDNLRRLSDANRRAIGAICYSAQNIRENECIQVLEALCKQPAASSRLSLGGNVLTQTPVEFKAPSESITYAAASHDWNPIHRSPQFALLAKLPDSKPIVHGMWTSASVRGLLEKKVADGNAERVVQYGVEFDGMVRHEEKLAAAFTHVGMEQGDMVVDVEVRSLHSRNRVLHGTALVRQPKTAYLFTGQGSAMPGMGMDRYAEVPAARHVWDTAERFLKDTYGFSILDIVRNNPKELTVHFGGAKGSTIRNNYRSIVGEDGERIIHAIHKDTRSFTFKSPGGLLFATQFAQPALVLVQKAAFDELLAKGLVPNDAVFAGHSLGEYAALASFARVLSVEDLVDTVFKRGMVMQNAVQRNAQGASDYAMIAANPSRVSKSFSPDSLLHLVERLAKCFAPRLLQVVNYNVEGQQYVIAGEKRMLEALRKVLDYLKLHPEQLVTEELMVKAFDAEGEPMLRRGSATIPLPGIDVPFHSRKLLSGVPSFRKLLAPKLKLDTIAAVLPLLIGKYIPNVLAEPFSTKDVYIEKVWKVTQSPALAEILNEDGEALSEDEKARLLVIELLAYQFAMPVQWIQTQHVLFSAEIQRIIEMGPAPVLKGMAKKSLSSGVYGKAYRPKLLWWKQDRSQIFYEVETDGQSLAEYFQAMDDKEEELSIESVDDKEDEQLLVPQQQTNQETLAQVVQPLRSSAPSTLSTLHAVRVLLSVKLQLPLQEVKATDTIAGLCQGKSAVQNEIVGELAKEFKLEGDVDLEGSLSEVSAVVKGYTSLGPVLKHAVEKAAQSRFPAGFGMQQAKRYVTEKWVVDANSILLHGLTLIPKARMKTPSVAHKWLGEVVEDYSADQGKPLEQVLCVQTLPATVSQPIGAVTPIPDESVKALHALRIVLALKFDKGLKDIKDTDTVAALSQGKSSLQNEVMGDLSQEFSFREEATPEMELRQLASSTSGYTAPGKFTSGLIRKMAQSKFPAGKSINDATGYLSSSKGLGPERSTGVFMHGLIRQPEKRLSSQEFEAWLHEAAEEYASCVGVALGAATMVAQQGVPGVALNDPEVQKLKKLLRRQHDAYVEIFEPHQLASIPMLSGMEDSMLVGLQAELGDRYISMIQPEFSEKKRREYNSFWNWVVLDALEMHLYVLATIKGTKHPALASNSHFQSMAKWITTPRDQLDESPPRAWFRNFLCNRATPELLSDCQYFAKAMSEQGNHDYAQAITLLAEQVSTWLNRPAVYVSDFESLRPVVLSSPTSGIEYTEEPREKVEDPVAYVAEMSRGLEYDQTLPTEVRHPRQAQTLEMDRPMAFADADEVKMPAGRKPRSASEIDADLVQLPSGERLAALRKSISLKEEWATIRIHKRVPLLHIKTPSKHDPSLRILDEPLTSQYLSCLHEIATNGVSFGDQVALVTGASVGSIAFQMVKGLLEGGATVIVTMRHSKSDKAVLDAHKAFQELYQRSGSKGSRLISVPFNGASAQDVHQVVAHIYNDLGLDIDIVVPFAAASEKGVDITGIGSSSEGLLRLMLTNLMRLLGAIKEEKARREIRTRPAMVIVPCSPNHGEFGMDGLYAEAKLGCESLMHKWKSEAWEDYLCIVSAVIGWTRSALMHQNQMVAEGVEALGLRTFSTEEMAFNLLGLLHPSMFANACDAPIWADLTGSWTSLPDLAGSVKDIRKEVQSRSRGERHAKATLKLQPLGDPSRMCTAFPKHMSQDRAQELEYLEGKVDLRKVVVCVGFGEIGPWGNARTRWEYECHGEFSLEGSIELAWLLGFIRYSKDPGHIGWIDSSSGAPVQDVDVKKVYEERLLQDCGIRLVDPALVDGYDPEKKMMMRKVAITRQLEPVEVGSIEEAEQYRREVGEEFVRVIEQDGQIFVQLLQGAEVSIPRAMCFNRRVAGQIPKGWDPVRLGVPKDIAQSVDPVTLYALVSTVDALVSAGLTDPYELYNYVHLSEVGNTSGGGMGGMRSLKRMFFQRKMDEDIPSDTLAESFINTMPAWVNMLLLSSAGPIKTPVGACATAAESVDIGVDTILTGKARVVITGGNDDFGETGSYEFAQMGATNATDVDQSRGRQPFEASRPMTDSRDGFVEAQGSGMQVLMDAALAIEMGVPIYAVLALTSTASDKQGRSVPAPGKGILTTAREVSTPNSNAERDLLLSFDFRAEQLEAELGQVDKQMVEAKSKLELQELSGEEKAVRQSVLEKQFQRKREGAFETWSNGFYRGDPCVAPIRGSLAVWGLSVDDIAVASFHGTSTKLNDTNESDVVNKQLGHLGRSKGNVMLVVAQKYLTGHPKGAAAAWMLNGLLQSMQESVVPGNRNLDNVDVKLRRNQYLLYPNRAVALPVINAAFLKSFGFGQAGAEVVLVHPDFCLAVLNETERAEYYRKRDLREKKMFRYQQGVFSGRHSLVQIKDSPPFDPAQEESVYLDPSARATYSAVAKTWLFKGTEAPPRESQPARKVNVKSSKSAAQQLIAAMKKVDTGSGNDGGIGVDVEPISTFNEYKEKSSFIDNNFTAKEKAYCLKAAFPAASFAGKWAAKEAVIKAITSASDGSEKLWKGAGAPLIDIEVTNSVGGAPEVRLTGHAESIYKHLRLSSIKVSISHTDEYALAQAVAR